MKKNSYLLFSFFLFYSLNNYSQAEVKSKKNSLSFSVGLPGFGFSYSRKIRPNINVVFTYNTISLNNYEIKGFSLKNDEANILSNLNIKIIDLGIEYLPFTKSSFKLTAGVGFISKLELDALITYTKEVIFGDIIISQQSIGEIDVNAFWSGVSPFIGVGFGRAIPRKNFGISFELGTYFTSSPDMNLNATNLLSSTSEQEDNLKKALNSFKFIPRILIKLIYKF